MRIAGFTKDNLPLTVSVSRPAAMEYDVLMAASSSGEIRRGGAGVLHDAAKRMGRRAIAILACFQLILFASRHVRRTRMANAVSPCRCINGWCRTCGRVCICAMPGTAMSSATSTRCAPSTSSGKSGDIPGLQQIGNVSNSLTAILRAGQKTLEKCPNPPLISRWEHRPAPSRT